MPCYNPLGGWRSRNANDNGRVPVVFGLRDGWVDQPIDIPCGKCPGCLQDRATAWGVRAYHESTMHVRCAFVTLTYDDSHLPADGRLDKSHLQNFFKRVRKQNIGFRYMACGEYGGLTNRPHYHVLFFGQDFRDNSVPCGLSKKQVDEYYSRDLERFWPFGHHVVSDVNAAACFYTAGYLLKNQGKDDSFLVSSKRPYIGFGWLQRYASDVARLGFVTIDGQRKIIPPSYLRRPEFALEFDALKEQRKEYVRNRTPDEVCRMREAARGKEANLIARSKLRKNVI